MEKANFLFFVSMCFIVVYWIVAVFVVPISGPITTLYSMLTAVSFEIGYGGTFFISILGNATVLVPFPYIAVIFVQGGIKDSVTHAFVFDPTLVGIVAGIGALLGEMTGYVAGYYGGGVIAQEKRIGFRDFILRHPRAIPFFLWFLAVTPLPDDVLVVPLGISRYSWWKVAVPQLLGKIMFLIGIAWAGRLGLSWAEKLIAGNTSLGVVGITIETVAMISLIGAIYLLVKIDWSKFVNKSSS